MKVKSAIIQFEDGMAIEFTKPLCVTELVIWLEHYSVKKEGPAMGAAVNLANPSPDRGLTADELEAVELAGQLMSHISQHCVGKGRTREDDLREFAIDIHHIQARVMSQAAARAHPDKLRKLGSTLNADH